MSRTSFCFEGSGTFSPPSICLRVFRQVILYHRSWKSLSILTTVPIPGKIARLQRAGLMPPSEWVQALGGPEVGVARHVVWHMQPNMILVLRGRFLPAEDEHTHTLTCTYGDTWHAHITSLPFTYFCTSRLSCWERQLTDSAKEAWALLTSQQSGWAWSRWFWSARMLAWRWVSESPASPPLHSFVLSLKTWVKCVHCRNFRKATGWEMPLVHHHQKHCSLLSSPCFPLDYDCQAHGFLAGFSPLTNGFPCHYFKFWLINIGAYIFHIQITLVICTKGKFIILLKIATNYIMK